MPPRSKTITDPNPDVEQDTDVAPEDVTDDVISGQLEEDEIAAAKEAAAEFPAEKKAEHYVVVADAVTLLVHGRKKGETAGARFVRGNIVATSKLHPDADPEMLVALRALVPYAGRNATYRRTNAMMMARAAGGIEDPVKVPEPDVTPEAHTADDDADDE